ncbi:MAG TPA: DNA repair protein RecN [Nitrospirae bacterium]|nr:DNA repair protein RecN [Nitrospirota bacterium]
MLVELNIKNFTIIKNLNISFKEGLNLLTGETGAGKSIIVDALSMLITTRASAEFISSGAQEAHIEAVFTVFNNIDLPLLNELSINYEDTLILRRVISSQGRSRAYINDTSVSIQTLIKVGSQFIVIHGQHDFQSLLKREVHLEILDRFSQLQGECKLLRELYEKSKRLRSEYDEILNNIRERAKREEFLLYQINEIDEARLKVGEMEELTEEFNMLSNISRLRDLSEDAYYQLYSADNSATERLKKAHNSILSLLDVDKGLSEAGEALKTAIAYVDDCASIIRAKKDSYEANPNRLEMIADRLDLIKRLSKKYGDTIQEILNYRKVIEGELQNLIDSKDRQREIEEELFLTEKGLKIQADKISHLRKLEAKKLQEKISQELTGLGFKEALFEINIQPKAEITSTGLDEVEFLFSANPGEPIKPLIKVASGGELSRIMLALRSVSFDSLDKGKETLIFDEVDAGIGGQTALQVGKRLKGISRQYQTLCITHLPQIASLADNHLMIEKITSDESVEITVRELNQNDRKMEIARMLSGTITVSSLKHAEELIKEAPCQSSLC